MKIIVADDEHPKLSRISDWLKSVFPDADVSFSRSVRSTIDLLRERLPDVLLLDMSLPTFDVAPGESGGRPQGFGGVEVLRNMDFYGIQTPVIVVTQYEAFPDKGKHVGLSELSAKLRREHANSFVACVFYSAVSDEWKIALRSHIHHILGEQ